MQKEIVVVLIKKKIDGIVKSLDKQNATVVEIDKKTEEIILSWPL